MARQQYTPEFKRRTLELLAESGKTVPQLAHELGISDNTLYGWRLAAKSDKDFTRQPQCSEQELEIRRLKRKVSELEEDKLILKKWQRSFPGKAGKVRCDTETTSFPLS